MNAKELILAIEQLGVTRYRISKDTGIFQTNLSDVLHDKKGMAKPNTKKLKDYYEKIISEKAKKD